MSRTSPLLSILVQESKGNIAMLWHILFIYFYNMVRKYYHRYYSPLKRPGMKKQVNHVLVLPDPPDFNGVIGTGKTNGSYNQKIPEKVHTFYLGLVKRRYSCNRGDRSSCYYLYTRTLIPFSNITYSDSKKIRSFPGGRVAASGSPGCGGNELTIAVIKSLSLVIGPSC